MVRLFSGMEKAKAIIEIFTEEVIDDVDVKNDQTSVEIPESREITVATNKNFNKMFPPTFYSLETTGNEPV